MLQLLLAIEYEDFELSQDHSNLIKYQVDNITSADSRPVLTPVVRAMQLGTMRGWLGSPQRMPRP